MFPRKYQAEQELGRKTWIVDFSEIQVRKGKFNDSFLSKSVLNLEEKVILILINASSL
jgi:hypothetical protein